MIEMLILSAVVVIALAATLAFQIHSIAKEREDWHAERRFLIDRAIAQHVGEVVALEREDTRKNETKVHDDTPRPLLEGLS